MEGADNTIASRISNGKCESQSLATSSGESDLGLSIVFTNSESCVSREEDNAVDGDRDSMLIEWGCMRKEG